MQELLAKFGLSEREIAVYLYLLRNPDRPAGSLAIGLKMNRTTLYGYLNILKERGLVFKTIQGGWRGTHPDEVISDFYFNLKLLKNSFANFKELEIEKPYNEFFDNYKTLSKSILQTIKNSTKIVLISSNEYFYNKISLVCKNQNLNLDRYTVSEASSDFIKMFYSYFDFIDILIFDSKFYILFKGGLFGVLVQDEKICNRLLSYL